jgi:hypothetical protein
MSSAVSLSAATTLAFGGACAYSVYLYFSALAASSAAASDVAKARTFSDAELIAVLTAVESRARRITGETEAALRLARAEASGAGAPGGAGGAAAAAAGGGAAAAAAGGGGDAVLEQVARARVQAELAAAQADVCRAAGFSESDVALALTLAQEREGGERAGAVTAAATRVRQVAGKWLLTKRGVLDAMAGTYHLQAVLMQELVEEALTTKVVTGGKSLQRFLGSPRVSKRVQDALHAYTLQKTGLSIMELDDFTRKPEFMEVREGSARARALQSVHSQLTPPPFSALSRTKQDHDFVAAIARVAEQGSALLQSRQDAMLQMVMQLTSGGH